LRHSTYRSHRVTRPWLKYIMDPLGVLNSPNNGILIGISKSRKSAGAEVSYAGERGAECGIRATRLILTDLGGWRPVSSGDAKEKPPEGGLVSLFRRAGQVRL
jgi:hypothetical protein